MKVVVFSYTPVWIASILLIAPSLGLLVTLMSLYSLYLFYLGLPVLMETPAEKRLVYFGVVVLVTIIVAVIMGLLSGLALGSAHMAMTSPMFDH
ncbi:MAG: YIP1 family protein [Syntrophorhabdales bacterium]|jgi:hypothetical protein